MNPIGQIPKCLISDAINIYLSIISLKHNVFTTQVSQLIDQHNKLTGKSHL